MIISAITDGFVDDFLFFYQSVRNHTDLPVYLCGVDLTASSKTRLAATDVHLFDPPEFNLPNFHSRHVQWYKPHIIRLAVEQFSLETALWLDADIIVTGSLKPLVNYLKYDFLVVRDYFAPLSCLNGQQLYDEFGVEPDDTAINTGLVGFQLARDGYILDKWVENTEKISHKPHLLKHIRLLDQGILLWSLHELGIIDKVLPYSSWNSNARRNCYEPTDNLLIEVEADNPEVSIVHFAGIPKLTQLCEVNHPNSIQHLYHTQHQIILPQKLFGVGLTGVDSVAPALRTGCQKEHWIRTNYSPSLALEISLKQSGSSYYTQRLRDTFSLYNRRDAHVIIEANPQLSHFISELVAEVPRAKFLLELDHPIQLLQTRLPEFGNLEKTAAAILTELSRIMQMFHRLPDDRWGIIWTGDFDTVQSGVERLIPGVIDWAVARNTYSQHRRIIKTTSDEWLKQQIVKMQSSYLMDFFKTVRSVVL